MKVICKYNKTDQLISSQNYQNMMNYYSLNYELAIDIGEEFIVYGIIFRDNAPWYYICKDEDDEFPTPIYYEFFNIIENIIPSHWQLYSKTLNDYVHTELVFPEWAADDMFYENLLDGGKKEIEIFKKEKMLYHSPYKKQN